MPPRKRRVSVVLDTNVIVGFYLSRTARSAAREIFRLWRDLRRIQLIVSDEHSYRALSPAASAC